MKCFAILAGLFGDCSLSAEEAGRGAAFCGRRIDNPPQVGNLPHKALGISVAPKHGY